MEPLEIAALYGDAWGGDVTFVENIYDAEPMAAA
jgi:hypothetical protein